MTKVIKAIIFDFFGVLVTEGFKQFRETHFAEDKTKASLAIALINQVDAGFISLDDFSIQLANLAGITPAEVDKQLGDNIPNRPLLDFIRSRLKGKYKLSILSNSSSNYPSKLLESADIELFNDILLSFQHGIVKPQPEIYQMAASRLGVRPEECIFIDDSYGHYQGAKNVGMQAILYSNFGQMKAELTRLLTASSNN